MLDPDRGILSFEQPAVAIAPSLTRDQFLQSDLAADATTHVENEPHHSWRLAPRFRAGAVEFIVVLWFHDQRLVRLTLMDADDRFGTSWAEYSIEKELARKRSHDAWLAASLQSRDEFPWGRVWSDYDERGGFSSITIHYAESR